MDMANTGEVEVETSDQMTGVIWALLGCRYNFYSYGFSKTEIAEARRPSTPKLAVSEPWTLYTEDSSLTTHRCDT